MKKCGKGFPLAFFLTLLLPAFSAAAGTEAEPFPRIARLDTSDTAFRQYIADVEYNRGRVFNREKNRESPRALAESLTIYQYTPREGEDIFSLAARCNIPFSALASLNRLNHPLLPGTDKPLLLPSSPGLFIPGNPGSDLERLLASSRFPPAENDSAALVIALNGPSGAAERKVVFHFYPGAEFDSTERAFFLNTGFSLPLNNFRLTSGYGMRHNPVTGNVRMHHGLDLAAPEGTGVYAAGEGVVTEIGEDSIYGIYVIIQHGENWASLYGHLREVLVPLRSAVQSGILIGRVGSTGQSTGPHLHFELRQRGKAQNPDKYLFLPRR
ncbi:MAG: M23 family metallopeptidase [Treponema sp.]|jgi:murein DD-endopeptidase MepM/ murein hydrolase activator NlpD|nr:M23 family metallopeptidase [Treponema sp.]